MIVNTEEPFQLKDVIRDFKRHTTKIIIDQIKHEPESRREWMLYQFEKTESEAKRSKTYKFWKTSNHAIERVTERFTWTKINYIHKNPVNAGFVNNAHDWKYSSASNYQNLDSLLPEVVCLAGMMQTVR